MRWFVRTSVVFGTIILSILLGAICFSLYESSPFGPALTYGRANRDKPNYIADDVLGWRLIPNLTIIDRKTRNPVFFTDPRGFRNPVPTKSHYRAIVLGDSFVQGYFLSNKETIPSRLAQHFEKPVYNLGVGGYSTDQQLLALKESLNWLKVDHVVLIFFINDLPYLQSNEAWGMQKPYFPKQNNGQLDFSIPVLPQIPTPRARFVPGSHPHTTITLASPNLFLTPLNKFRKILQSNLKRMSVFFRHPQRTISAQKRFRHKGFQLRLDKYTHPSALDQEWDLAFQIFEQMNAVALNNQAKFLIFFLPELNQVVRGDPTLLEPQKKFNLECSRRSLSCLDPYHRFVRKQWIYDLYFRNDGHLSPRGADFTAKLLAEHIRNSSD